VAAQPKVDAGTGATAAPAKTMSLTANMQVNLSNGPGVSGEAVNSQPVKISESQLTALKAETKIADNTFSKAVTIEPMSSNDSGGGGNRGEGNRSPASESGPKLILPPVAVLAGPPPIIDVPGRPTMDSQTRGPINGLKRLVVTIVTQ
jgi:hypothetical protein